MASRREQGLCFNFDEKFTRGHQCAFRFFLLIADEEQEDDVADLKIEFPAPSLDDPPQAQISLYALSG